MPTPTTYQANSMPHAPGILAPGLDSTGFISNIAMKLRVVAKTSAYTVNANESGTFFTTYGATAAVTFTLPAVASGLIYFFSSAADVAMTVAAGTAETMVAYNNVAADSIALGTASKIVGGIIVAVCDGTYWHTGLIAGQSTQTVTIAD